MFSVVCENQLAEYAFQGICSGRVRKTVVVTYPVLVGEKNHQGPVVPVDPNGEVELVMVVKWDPVEPAVNGWVA